MSATPQASVVVHAQYWAGALLSQCPAKSVWWSTTVTTMYVMYVVEKAVDNTGVLWSCWERPKTTGAPAQAHTAGVQEHQNGRVMMTAIPPENETNKI